MGPDRSHVSDALKAVDLFAALSAAELESLTARTAVQHKAAGETLFIEGEPCAGLYIVASGRVRIFKTSPGGREQVLAVQGPGSSVAELPVFDGGTYPASAIAVDDSELLFVSRQHFRNLCLEHPEVALKALQLVGGRLRRLVGIIEELSFATVRGRLMSWLLKSSEGRDLFPLTVTHHELAAQIGTVRELVSRNIVRLQAEGFIAMNGREVRILDRAAMETELAQAR
jgi:CRP/FNR family cyclic AMP-dependent transcriptional regulator